MNSAFRIVYTYPRNTKKTKTHQTYWVVLQSLCIWNRLCYIELFLFFLHFNKNQSSYPQPTCQKTWLLGALLLLLKNKFENKRRKQVWQEKFGQEKDMLPSPHLTGRNNQCGLWSSYHLLKPNSVLVQCYSGHCSWGWNKEREREKATTERMTPSCAKCPILLGRKHRAKRQTCTNH